MHTVAAHWGELPPREQQILIMDFRGGMTQAQIGKRLHISQMHVSRLRGRALGHLRSRLLGPEPHAAPIPAPRQHPGRHTTTTGSNRLPAGPRSADTLPGRHQRPARPANALARPRTTAGIESFQNPEPVTKGERGAKELLHPTPSGT